MTQNEPVVIPQAAIQAEAEALSTLASIVAIFAAIILPATYLFIMFTLGPLAHPVLDMLDKALGENAAYYLLEILTVSTVLVPGALGLWKERSGPLAFGTLVAILYTIASIPIAIWFTTWPTYTSW
jgi:hypothetical protein